MRSGRAGEAVGTAPRVLFVDVDPALATLVRQQLPRLTTVLVPPEDDLDALLAGGPDLVVVDLASPRRRHVRLYPHLRVLGVGPGPVGVDADDVDAVLARPYDAPTVRRTIERLVAPRPRRLRLWPTGASLLPLAEMAALAMALPVLGGHGVVVFLAFVVAVVATLAPLQGHGGHLVAVGVATVLLVGGAGPAFLPYALVVAVRAGLEGGVVTGAVGGAVLAIASLPNALAGVDDLAMVGRVVATSLVFPLIAWAVGHGASLRPPGRFGRGDTRELHRALRHLDELVQARPEDLSLAGAGQRIVDDAARRLGADAAVLLSGRRALREVARHGIAASVRVRPEGLPDGFTWRRWPLHLDGQQLGVLVVGHAPGVRHHPSAWRRRVAVRATALELANALRLRRLQQRGANAERGRLAEHLTEGVAQALIHVRYEVAALVRALPDATPALRDSAAHLEEVARRALLDIAAVAADLRSTSTANGLMGALHEFARDVMEDDVGPLVVVRGEAGPRLDPLTELEVYGLLCDAVEWARERAGATRVVVEVRRDTAALVAAVHDDGAGVETEPGAAHRYAQLCERAGRLGAQVRATTQPGRHGLELVLPGRGAGAGVGVP